MGVAIEKSIPEEGLVREVPIVELDEGLSNFEAVTMSLQQIASASGEARIGTVRGNASILASVMLSQNRPFHEVGTFLHALELGSEGGLLGTMLRVYEVQGGAEAFLQQLDAQRRYLQKSLGGVEFEIKDRERIENLRPGEDGERMVEVLQVIFGRINRSEGTERQAVVEYYAPLMWTMYLFQNRPVGDIARELLALALLDGEGILEAGRSRSPNLDRNERIRWGTFVPDRRSTERLGFGRIIDEMGREAGSEQSEEA